MLMINGGVIEFEPYKTMGTCQAYKNYIEAKQEEKGLVLYEQIECITVTIQKKPLKVIDGK
jgi:hypothetical protein